MKLLGKLTLAAGAGLLGVLLARTLNLPAAPLGQAVGLPAAIQPQRAAQSLAAAIRLPTISHQAGAPEAERQASREAFAGLRQWLAERYPQVSARLTQEATGSPTLLLRWPGRDRSQPAILLMAHQDVVPVVPGSEGDWVHPPFAGVIDQEYVWGRGAIDTKGSLVAILEAVEALLTEGYTPPQDVLLAFGHDEEIGGSGNRRLAERLQQQGQKLAWVNDEGGFIIREQIPGVAADVAVVGIAEKGYLSVRLSTRAAGGHSSQPPALTETAIGQLNLALQQLQDSPFEAHLDGPTGEMLNALAPAQPFWRRVVMANLWLFGPLVDQQLSTTPAGNAQLRTALAPTLLRAGIKENVLPTEASAILNLRLHPSDSVDSALKRLQSRLEGLPVTLKALPGAREPSQVSPTQAEPFQRFAAAIRASFGNTLVAPNLTVGGTDSRSYEALTPNIYRFSPLLMRPGDLARMHGTNERVAIADLARAAAFYYRLLGGKG